jgi:hypothetical protein
MLTKAKEGKTKEVLEKFSLLAPALPKFKPDLASGLYLMHGQALYSEGKYPEAIKAWAKVSNRSNHFAQAVIGTAWAHLQLSNYVGSVDSAYNLLVGPLQTTFQPEAYVVVGITMNEVCDFPRAIESIRLFKKSYGRVFKWLGDWQKTKTNLYPEVVAFIRGESKISDYIGLEWSKSPAFYTRQEEVNLRITERGLLAKALSQRGMAREQSLSALFKNKLEYSVAREKELIAEMNTELERISLRIRRSLESSSETLQLVEAEVYSSVGEKMILDNAGVSAKETESTTASPREGAVWDWGEFETKNEETAEVWTDELGFLRTELKNNCVR